MIGLTKLLGTGGEVVPLSEDEVAFLLEFGGEKQVVEMSEDIIENSKVIVTDGPLQGKEGLIKKIDRHKHINGRLTWSFRCLDGCRPSRWGWRLWQRLYSYGCKRVDIFQKTCYNTLTKKPGESS